jgi:acyl-CoA synthetase (NDP forming)
MAPAAGWNEQSAKALLAQAGLRVPRSQAASDAQSAAGACASLTPPFVVKVLSSTPLHKSELGGVRLGLPDAAAVAAAVRDIRAAWQGDPALIEGFLVEEMAPPGHELALGGTVDPQFGPLLMVGLGGIFVELFSDVSFRVCPIDEHDARAMLRELRAWPILQGARGGRVIDEPALLDAMLKLGGPDGLLLRMADRIGELDINPMIVSESGAVAADARIVAAPPRNRADAPPRRPLPDFAPLFLPRSVAVAGVSASGTGAGNRFIANLEALDYQGAIHPLHPTAQEIGGRRAYRHLADIPQEIDYAYIAVPRAAVPPLLAEAGGRVRFAQIMTSGFGEGGRGEGSKSELAQAIARGGMRVLGPNCLGIYSPRGRVSFTETGFKDAVGEVGIVSQSGGFGIDMVRAGQQRGLRFSGVVTIGNSIDLGANELLEHFLADPGTRVIGLYLEDIVDGRRFFELLRGAGARKPVVILKGGRTSQGQRAAASHTGSLAGNFEVWRAVARQTGCVLVDSLEEWIDSLLLFQLAPRQRAQATRRIALLGNGGGASVVATDGFAQLGFTLADFTSQTSAHLQALALPDGASEANPIDVPANVFDRTEGLVGGAILDALCADAHTDAIVMHLNLSALLAYRGRRTAEHLVDAAIAHRPGDEQRRPLLLVLRSDGSAAADAFRRAQAERAAAAGLPVFENFTMAARALKALATFEEFQLLSTASKGDPCTR